MESIVRVVLCGYGCGCAHLVNKKDSRCLVVDAFDFNYKCNKRPFRWTNALVVLFRFDA